MIISKNNYSSVIADITDSLANEEKNENAKIRDTFIKGMFYKLIS